MPNQCMLRRGITPLHFAAAAKKNAKAVCEALLKGGADAEVADMSGRVPFGGSLGPAGAAAPPFAGRIP